MNNYNNAFSVLAHPDFSVSAENIHFGASRILLIAILIDVHFNESI